MSKQFAMLTATRRLENHLSRESFNLQRMTDNDRIPYSLLETKVAHHNDLVDALNDLFAILSDSPSSKLFAYYNLPALDEESFTVINHEESDEEEPIQIDQAPFESKSEIPLWRSGGYGTYDAWLADKEAEFAQDDLTLGVNDGLSRHRAQQALDEYSETSERDIATYLPEDDQPVNVLPSVGAGSNGLNESIEDDMKATDFNYLDHTVDNVRVDSDPTQIAGVETAVERYGENARKGTDIDVSSFLYQSESMFVDDLISDDIERLQGASVDRIDVEPHD